METKQDYVDKIKEKLRESVLAEREAVKLMQEIKRKYGFMQGDRVKYTTVNFEGEKEEYYLYIDHCHFSKEKLDFEYTFKYLTAKGKPSNLPCGVRYNPKTDTIEKI